MNCAHFWDKIGFESISNVAPLIISLLRIQVWVNFNTGELSTVPKLKWLLFPFNFVVWFNQSRVVDCRFLFLLFEMSSSSQLCSSTILNFTLPSFCLLCAERFYVKNFESKLDWLIQIYLTLHEKCTIEMACRVYFRTAQKPQIIFCVSEAPVCSSGFEMMKVW